MVDVVHVKGMHTLTDKPTSATHGGSYYNSETAEVSGSFAPCISIDMQALCYMCQYQKLILPSTQIRPVHHLYTSAEKYTYSA